MVRLTQTARTALLGIIASTIGINTPALNVQEVQFVNTVGGGGTVGSARVAGSVSTIGRKTPASTAWEVPFVSITSGEAFVVTATESKSANILCRGAHATIATEIKYVFISATGATAKSVQNAIYTCVRIALSNRQEVHQDTSGKKSLARNYPVRVLKYTMNCLQRPYYKRWTLITQISTAFNKISFTTPTSK